jgi:hypothetical protein
MELHSILHGVNIYSYIKYKLIKRGDEMVLEVTGIMEVFAIGVFGGCLAELAKWFKIREEPSFPGYAKSLKYWIITILLILTGGVLALLYGYTNVEALLALNIGASAPLIIAAIAAAVPAGTPGTPSGEPSLLNFLAGR